MLLGIIATVSVMTIAVTLHACWRSSPSADATQMSVSSPTPMASATDGEGNATLFSRIDWRQSSEMLLARKLLVDGMMSVHRSIDISSANLKSEFLSDTYHGIMDEEPWLWYVRGTCSYERDADGTVLSVRPDYISSDIEEIERTREEYEQEMTALLSSVSADMSDLAKVKALHDGIVSRCSYNKECAGNPEGYEVTLHDNPYGAYSAMVSGFTVCRGYSLAFKDACTRAGISCVTVRTREHEWNKVMVHGKWYNVDLTFDDTDDSQTHQYALFMKSDRYLVEYDVSSKKTLHANAFPSGLPAIDTTYDNPTALLAALM